MGADDRRLAIEKLRVRAEIREEGLEENTGEIDLRAISRAPKSSSTPAPARGVVAILNARPSWSLVVLLLGAAALFAAGGMLRPAWDRLIEWIR